MICAVADCNRPGSIELNFGNHYESRRKANEAVCSYHAGMAVDFFRAMGFDVPISMTLPSRPTLDRTGMPQRYVTKSEDNTEYDDGHAGSFV